jgi:hypothetical protein
MNKKGILLAALAGLAALGLVFVSCDNGSTGGPAGNMFILTNLSAAQLNEGSQGDFTGGGSAPLLLAAVFSIYLVVCGY